MKKKEEKTVLRNDKNNIRYVIHISDIHVKKEYLDIEEYKEYSIVFKNLINKLKSLKLNRNNSVCIITGDILDKQTVDNDGANLLCYLYENLNKITDVISIIGNHEKDFNKTLLRYIIKNVNSNYKSYLLENSGSYVYNNIIFGYTGMKENEIFVPKREKNKLNIALYHGQVKYPELSEVMIKEEMFDIEDFESYYDFCCFGDIHQNIKISDKSAYCGSLIQLRKSENLEKGINILDLEKKKIKFVKITNPYGYAIIEIAKNGKIKLLRARNKNPCDLKIKKNEIEILLKYLPDKIKLTIRNKYKNNNILENIKKEIEKEKEIIEYICNDEHDYNLSLNIIHDGEKKDIKTFNTKKSVYELIYNKIKKINELPNKIENDLIKILKNLISENMEKENKKEKKQIKLKYIKFKNIMAYSYGEINFEKLKNIILIPGNNSLGKSSLIESIIFSLYDSTTKIDQSQKINIIRSGSKKFMTEITLEVNNIEYIILREGTIEKNNKVTEKVKISKNKEIIYEGGIIESNKLIEKIICSQREFINICVLNSQIRGFLKLSDKDKINFLKKISGLEILEKINKSAESNKRSLTLNKGFYNKIKKKYGDSFTDIIISMNKTIENHKEELKNIEKNIDINTKKLYEIMKRIMILENNTKQEYIDVNDLEIQKEELTKELNKIIHELNTIEKENNILSNNKIKEKINVLFEHKLKVLNIENNLDNINKEIVILETKKKEIIKKERKVYNLKKKIETLENNNTKKTKEEILKKLQNEIVLMNKKEIGVNIKKLKKLIKNQETEKIKEYESYDNSEKELVKFIQNNSSLKDKDNEYKRFLEKKFNIENKLENINKNIEENKNINITDINKNKEKLDKEKNTLEELNNIISKLRIKKGNILSDNARIKENLKEITNAYNETKKLDEQIEIYKIINNCLDDKNFIQKLLEDTIIINLEKFINKYTTMIKLPKIKLMFDKKKSSKNKTLSIYNDETNKLIETSGTYHFNMMNIILSICIAKINNEYQLNCLFIDELTDGSSEKNISNAVKLLYSINEISDYDFILLISHNEIIKNSINSAINIKKLNDGTRTVCVK